MADPSTPSRRRAILVVWARMKPDTSCASFPQFVAAFSEGEVDAIPESYYERRAEAEQWFRDFGDQDEVDFFFTTWAQISDPALPTREEVENCA